MVFFGIPVFREIPETLFLPTFRRDAADMIKHSVQPFYQLKKQDKTVNTLVWKTPKVDPQSPRIPLQQVADLRLGR